MFKNFFFRLCFIPMTIVAALLMIIITGPLGLHGLNRKISSWWSRITLRLANASIEADLSLMSADKKRGQIIMTNHKNLFDIPVLFALLKDVPFRFVAKKSLFQIPLFGWAMAATGHISIDRHNRRQAMQGIKEAENKIHQGISIVIFPEGTRSKNPDALGKFQIGGFIMAIQAETDIQPILIDGTIDIMAPGTLSINPGKHALRIKALAPIPTDSYTIKEREALKEHLEQIMSSAFTELRNSSGK